MATVVEQLNVFVQYFGVEGCKTGLDPNLKIPSLTTKDGKQVNGLVTIFKYLIENSKQKNGLLGQSLEDQCVIDQWLEYRTSDLEYALLADHETILQELNHYLENKVYFVGNKLSLADLVLFCGLHNIYKKLDFKEKQLYSNVSRWFNLIQHEECLAPLRHHFSHVVFSKTTLY
ncbi:eukaryotic translation elongation factor 1 epsilon-1 [Centruroides vittatus]|uniref:eukaryotic translation elongation factor 1 epsilon-1 n=1 Tax=Centruroides vittatus TaxID=120091 RepID=UPI003510BDC8